MIPESSFVHYAIQQNHFNTGQTCDLSVCCMLVSYVVCCAFCLMIAGLIEMTGKIADPLLVLKGQEKDLDES